MHAKEFLEEDTLFKLMQSGIPSQNNFHYNMSISILVCKLKLPLED